MDKEIPVYLITGFIDSGKTTFIQETLEDREFNNGSESILVIQCEEGDTPLDLEAIGGSNVHVEYLDKDTKLNPVNLERLVRLHNADSVMMEFNGMWMIDKLYEGMPESWMIYQEYAFFEAGSFMTYNQAMRQLVYDKLQTCSVAVFNRFDWKTMDYMEFHKIVRAVTRRADIFYEDLTRDAKLDETVDPLPFDKNADFFEVSDRDYALWYRDLSESMDDYQGKRVKVKGALGGSDLLKGGDFVFGREMMTCCVEDIRMAALVCEWSGAPVKIGSWATVTGKISIRRHKAYGSKKGPVITVEKIEPCPCPEEPVATFY